MVLWSARSSWSSGAEVVASDGGSVVPGGLSEKGLACCELGMPEVWTRDLLISVMTDDVVIYLMAADVCVFECHCGEAELTDSCLGYTLGVTNSLPGGNSVVDGMP